MMRGLLIVVSVASFALAQGRLPGEGGLEVRTSSDLVDSSVSTLVCTSNDLTCTSTATGEVTISLGSNASELGSCIGDVLTEFCNPTYEQYEVDGGSTASANLKLCSSSQTTSPTGAVQICPTAISIGSAGVASSMTIYAGGVSTNGTALGVVGPDFTGTVTQNSQGVAGSTPLVYPFSDDHFDTVTDSAANITVRGVDYSFYAGPTTQNATDDNQTGMVQQLFSANPHWSKTSTGTLTIASVASYYSRIDAPPSGVTLTAARDFHANDVNGTVSGTLTSHYGFYSAAMSKGTLAMPFGAARISALTGTPAAGDGGWGVETGPTTNADRFVFENGAGHTHRLSEMSIAVKGLSVAGSTTYICPGYVEPAKSTNGRATPTTENTQECPIPGSLHIYGMACGTNAAQGASKTLAITVRSGTTGALANTSAAVTFSNSNTPLTFRSETGIAIATASGELWDVSAALTSGGTASDYWCTILYLLDAW